MFEELSHTILQKRPSLNVEGNIYPPPAWRSSLPKLVQLIELCLIIVTASGIDPFSSLGFHAPITTYAPQNKTPFCLTNSPAGILLEGHLLAAGAIEIFSDYIRFPSKTSTTGSTADNLQPHEI